MISSLIPIFIFVLLSLSSNHGFYFKNADILEQCKDKVKTLSINAFKYMSCFNNQWRRSTLNLKYSCTKGRLQRTWYFKTDNADNPNVRWPSDIMFLTGNDYLDVPNALATNELVIDDASKSSGSSQNQFVTYFWTSLPQGPQCRLKYTIIQEKCSKTDKIAVPTFNEFTCYYGPRSYSLSQPTQRTDFDVFIDNYKKTIPSKQITTIDPKRHSNQSSNHSNLLPMKDTNTDEKTKKMKKIFIIGGIILLFVVVIILAFVFCRNSSSSSSK